MVAMDATEHSDGHAASRTSFLNTAYRAQAGEAYIKTIQSYNATQAIGHVKHCFYIIVL
jgi:hypothetical protein